MSRKGDTVLAASLKRYGKKIKTYIENCIADDLKVNLLIEDARDYSFWHLPLHYI